MERNDKSIDQLKELALQLISSLKDLELSIKDGILLEDSNTVEGIVARKSLETQEALGEGLIVLGTQMSFLKNILKQVFEIVEKENISHLTKNVLAENHVLFMDHIGLLAMLGICFYIPQHSEGGMYPSENRPINIYNLNKEIVDIYGFLISNNELKNSDEAKILASVWYGILRVIQRSIEVVNNNRNRVLFSKK